MNIASNVEIGTSCKTGRNHRGRVSVLRDLSEGLKRRTNGRDRWRRKVSHVGWLKVTIPALSIFVES